MFWLISLWYLWIISVFMLPRPSLSRSIILLFAIIIYPLTWDLYFMTVSIFYILLVFLGFYTLPAITLFSRWYVVGMSIALSFLFAAVFMAEWMEPVIFLYGKTLTLTLGFGFIILLLFDDFKSRMAGSVLSIFGGTLIYQVHLFPLTKSIVLGDPVLLNVMLLVHAGITVLHGIEISLEKWSKRADKTHSGLPASQ
ncbi:hypothetical protein [Alteribacillus sp. HJP-4]|uniref:YphA family membrane protein n=1 Tax=Alteribacillus sp. HJP-4 TaxID=2775394 RepID=UPI0035CD05D1